MGHVTKRTVIQQNLTPEILQDIERDQRFGDVREYLIELLSNPGVTFSSKWYTFFPSLKTFTELYPSVKLVIQCDGEDGVDEMYLVYAYNGEVISKDAIIDYEELTDKEKEWWSL